MARSTATNRVNKVLGEYEVGRQIGSGSFSVVWHGWHRVHGTEVAIKEIVTERLNRKLQESLMSEIFILKKINHPNIVQLYDIIEVNGSIHLVLEYCKGGDLSMYIQQRGRAPECTAKLFMQQLATGLQILRDNNLIHRDLKPQNLLLSTNDSASVLKIADFGFARSLQPRSLAETLCGSPLYMAPEIMEMQKYDAKADLWSVGAILFQLVTGKTPFTGNNQIELLQNIRKSTQLHFPPDSKDLSSDCRDLCQKLLRRNPVERLTFEEFFHHPFLSPTQADEPLRTMRPFKTVHGITSSECNCSKIIEESSQGDCFFADEDCSGPDRSPSYIGSRSSMNSIYGCSPDTKDNRREVASKFLYKDSSGPKLDGFDRPSYENLKETRFMDQRPLNLLTRDSTVVDSLESVDQEYVFVLGLMDSASSFASASKPSHSHCVADTSPTASFNIFTTSSDPMPIVSSTVDKTYCISSLGSQGSAPSGTSQVSMDLVDISNQPSNGYMERIKSLQQCASAITDLINEEMEAGRQLEAFSIQLVILAIWKQALHICQMQTASAMEGSPTYQTCRFQGSISTKWGTSDMQEHIHMVNSIEREHYCFQIEREFLCQVEHAEELARVIKPVAGGTEMPDAMETIYQSALALGRLGAVDELMGEMERAEMQYSKAVCLLFFLLVEAPSLNLTPLFSLTDSGRYRLQSYIDILNSRQDHSRSLRMALLKCERLPCTP